jgi:hypothetical protein
LLSLFFAFFLSLLSSLASAQLRDWAVTHDNGGPDQVGCTHCDQPPFNLVPPSVVSTHAVAADTGGSSWITGGTWNGTNDDILTVGYDVQGAEKWSVTYDGGGDDSAVAAAVDTAGNVYVAGTTYRMTPDSGVQAHALVLKYDTAGNLLWERVYRKGIWSQGLALAVAATGTSFLAVQSYGQDDSSVAELLETSPDGKELATDAASFGFESEMQGPSAVALDAAGNAYMVGWLFKPSESDQWDYFVLQFGGWAKRWSSGSDDVAYDVAVDGAGRVFVVGSRGPVAFSSAGTLLWSASFPGLAHAVAAADGGVWVTGSSGEDFRTARYDATNGVRTWAVSSGGPGTDAAYVLRVVEGTVFVAGTSSNGSDNDVLTVGLNAATGAEVWQDRYDRNGDERAVAMTAARGGLWVAGNADEDTLTLRYSLRSIRPRS